MADDITTNLDKHFKKVEKQAKETELAEAERTRQIQKAVQDQSKAFKGIIENLREVMPKTAKVVADFKLLGDDTLKGALLNKKLILAANAATLAYTDGMDSLNEEQTNAIKAIFGDTVEELSKVLPEITNLVKDIEDTERTIAETKDSVVGYEKGINDTQNELLELAERGKAHKLSLIKQEEMQAELEALMNKKVHEKNKVLHGIAIGSLQDKIENIIAENNKEQQTIADMTAQKEELLAKQKDLLEAENSILNNQEKSLENLEGKKQLLLDKEVDLRDEMEANMEKAKSEQLKGLTDFSEGIKGLTGFDIIGTIDSAVAMFNNIKKVANGLALFSKGLFTKVMGFLKTNTIVQKAASMFTAALAGLGSMFGKLAIGFKTVMTSITTGAFSLTATLGKLAAGMKMAAKGLGRAMLAFIPAALAFVGSLLATATGMLIAALPYIAIAAAVIALGYAVYKVAEWIEEKTGFFSAWWSGISTMFSTAIGGLFDFFGGIGTFFYGLFTLDFGMMWEGLKQTFSGFWDVITSPLQGLFDFFSELFNFDIVGYFKNKVKDLPLVGSLFGGDEERDAQKDLADSSGILTRDWGMDTIDTSMVGRATDEQIQAILDTADVSPDDRRTLEGVLADRAAIRAADEQELAYQQEATIAAQASADEAGRNVAPYIITNAQSTNNSTSNVYPAAPQTSDADRYGATVPSTQFVY